MLKPINAGLRLLAIVGLILLWKPEASAQTSPPTGGCQPAPNPECTMCTSPDCDYVECGSQHCEWCSYNDGQVIISTGNACD